MCCWERGSHCGRRDIQICIGGRQERTLWGWTVIGVMIFKICMYVYLQCIGIYIFICIVVCLCIHMYICVYIYVCTCIIFRLCPLNQESRIKNSPVAIRHLVSRSWNQGSSDKWLIPGLDRVCIREA